MSICQSDWKGEFDLCPLLLVAEVWISDRSASSSDLKQDISAFFLLIMFARAAFSCLSSSCNRAISLRNGSWSPLACLFLCSAYSSKNSMRRAITLTSDISSPLLPAMVPNVDLPSIVIPIFSLQNLSSLYFAFSSFSTCSASSPFSNIASLSYLFSYLIFELKNSASSSFSLNMRLIFFQRDSTSDGESSLALAQKFGTPDLAGASLKSISLPDSFNFST